MRPAVEVVLDLAGADRGNVSLVIVAAAAAAAAAVVDVDDDLQIPLIFRLLFVPLSVLPPSRLVYVSTGTHILANITVVDFRHTFVNTGHGAGVGRQDAAQALEAPAVQAQRGGGGRRGDDQGR